MFIWIKNLDRSIMHYYFDNVYSLIKQIGQRKLEFLFAFFNRNHGYSFFIELGLIQPDPKELFKGIFIPYVPNSALQQMVGLIGSVLMPHNLYLHSSLVQEKKIHKQNIGLLKKSIFYFKIETGISLLVSFFISMAVIGTFAFWYVPGGGPDIDLTQAGDYLDSHFGIYAKYIWGVGLLAAGQSSTITGTLAGQYVMQGFIKFNVGKFKRAFFTRLVAIVPSILIAFLGDSNQDFNNYLNVLQAIQLPFAIIPLLKLSYNKQIMGNFTIGKIEITLLSILSAIIIGVNYYIQVPDSIDWSQFQVYIVIIVMALYFLFMVIILFTKLKLQLQSDQDQTNNSKIYEKPTYDLKQIQKTE
ncbi:natural resistance associated macrophage protein, putative [Ichthyophthirius multifiliis]|uniref:Natural resistance associated macrophage protein, putative n=1 Tax=Ichthyophthirius multifiliis TaxID=5932 RepID=G0R462_ICHMU|nr:natural resistance associated macrophage protein, putative [Ichthyophthirius multifiliis]EGR27733.1 natural resistance associated macrophage protein, putative [Ichthyophthirius multifiliis]|eukprot:XP_004025185.1 natural resistance associated macrophage protein, putative [Ichthyophthirius multifiliis]